MEWVAHYNHGRPHASLGPGIPDPQGEKIPELVHGHRLPVGFKSSRSLSRTDCIMSTDCNPLRKAGHEIGRHGFFCGSQRIAGRATHDAIRHDTWRLSRKPLESGPAGDAKSSVISSVAA